MSYYLHKGDPDRELIRANLHAFIDRLPETKSWEIEVSEWHKPRSDKQRSALFGCAYKPLMEFIGLRGEADKQELHRFFCGEYFGWKKTAFGRRPTRTTTRDESGKRDEISTLTALDFYAFIQQRAAEQGVMVPDPDPFWRDKLAQETARVAASNQERAA